MNEFLNKADHQIIEVNVPNVKEQILSSFKAKLRILKGDILSGENPAIPLIDRTLGLNKKSDEFKIDFVHRINENESYSLPLTKESKGTQRY